MGIVKACIEYQETLEELGVSLPKMAETIEKIPNIEEKAIFRFLQRRLEDSYKDLQNTSSILIDMIDRVI